MAQYNDPTGISVTSASAVSPLSVLVLVAGIVSAAIAGYSFLVISSTTAETERLEARITQNQNELEGYSSVAESLSRYNDISMGLTTLFDGQKRWEEVLGLLQIKLYSNMVVESIQLSETGQVTISGMTPNYTEYAKVYSSFTSSEMQEVLGAVKVTSVSQDEDPANKGLVKFSFSGTLTEKALDAGQEVDSTNGL